MIKIRVNGNWVESPQHYKTIFKKYVDQNNYCEKSYMENNITIYRENDDPYNPIYINDNNTILAICDWSNVKVFLLDKEPVDWYPARDYQIQSYYDFMYDDKIRKTYVSPNSLFYPNNTIINMPHLPPNIKFDISRNENRSVYYERDDIHLTKVRICDNEWARLGYRGFFTRMTMDIGMIITPPPNTNYSLTAKLPIPNDISLNVTNIENDQCVICFTYQKNLLLQPCQHFILCSLCYNNLINNNCPICRTNITNIISK